jgi:hypothetical protein
VGAGLAILASTVSNVGLSLQKLTHKRNAISIAASGDIASDATKINYAKQKLWLLGMFLV